MWGCLGRACILLMALVAGLTMVSALGALVLGNALPVTAELVPGEAISAGLDLGTLRFTRAPMDAQAAQGYYSAFGLTPVEWLFASVLVFSLAMAAAVFLAVLWAFGRTRRRAPADAAEATAVQDLYHLARRMEERIGSLETLLVAQERIRSAPRRGSARRHDTAPF